MSEEKSIETKAIATEQSPPELTPEQKKNEAKDGALGCIVLIVLIAVAWYFGKGFFVSEPINYITQDNTQERVAEKVLLDTLGKKANWKDNPPRIKSISIMQLANNGRALDVTFRTDENMTENMIRSGFIMKCTDSTTKIFESPELKDITIIRFMATLPLVDKYGKVEEDTVAKAQIPRKLSAKVDWANIGMDDVPALLNGEGGYFWAHPAIRN